MPWGTIILSVVLFVLTPFLAGSLTRYFVLRRHGEAAFARLTVALNYVTMAALLLTLVIIFIFQGSAIVEHWFHIILIAVPLTLQTFLSFAMAYGACYLCGLSYDVAAPAGFIGSSNFFELAVSVAITVNGPQSGAALATVVGVLTEVPTMLALVWFAKRTRHIVERRAQSAPLRRFTSLFFGTSQNKGNLLPSVAAFVDELQRDISAAAVDNNDDDVRRSKLESIAKCVTSMLTTTNNNDDDDVGARLLFLCTHNSRRSQLAQVWYAVAAAYYSLGDRIETFSAGTQSTLVPNTIVRVLRSVGMIVTRDDDNNDDDDERAVCTVRFSDSSSNALRLFSKKLDDSTLPSDDERKRRVCIVAVCADADQACPLGGKCRCRLALPYDDPKSADGRQDESSVYSARSRSIAREAFVVMRNVATSLQQRSSN